MKTAKKSDDIRLQVVIAMLEEFPELKQKVQVYLDQQEIKK